LCVTETRDGEKQSEGVSGSMTFMNKIGKLFMAMIHVKVTLKCVLCEVSSSVKQEIISQVSDRQCDVLVVGQGHSVEKGYPSLGGTCLFCLLHAPCHVLVARRCESS